MKLKTPYDPVFASLLVSAVVIVEKKAGEPTSTSLRFYAEGEIPSSDYQVELQMTAEEARNLANRILEQMKDA